ncbi:MAG: DMT family transporter [Deltaproteobacteria bacterium]|nr:DMT family transporter [Deltaproteobacteria bacterium]
MLRVGGLVFLALAWGTQYLVIKAGLATLPPLLTVALRYAVLLAAAQAALVVTRSPPATAAAWKRGAFGLSQAASVGLLYWAQARLPSSLVGILIATTPFLVAVLAHFLLPGERLRRAAVIATLLGFAGAALIAARAGPAGADGMDAAAVAAVLLAALTDAVTKVLAKDLTASTPVPVMLRDMALCVCAGAGAGWWLLERDAPVVFTPAAVGAFVYLGLVASAGASAVYLLLLRRYSVSGLAYLQFVTAAVAVLTGVAVGGETLGVTTTIGVLLVLAGLAARSAGQAAAPR